MYLLQNLLTVDLILVNFDESIYYTKIGEIRLIHPVGRGRYFDVIKTRSDCQIKVLILDIVLTAVK